MIAFFPHGPLVENVPINLLYDEIHSILATITGFSFTLLAVGHGAMSQGKQRVGGFIMALIAVLVSSGMMVFPLYRGIFQRIMFVSAFGWLFVYLELSSQNRLPSKNSIFPQFNIVRGQTGIQKSLQVSSWEHLGELRWQNSLYFR